MKEIKKFKIRKSFDIPVTQKEIDAIVDMAREGIWYWCDIQKHKSKIGTEKEYEEVFGLQKLSELMKHTDSLELHNKKDDKWYRLTYEKIAYGIRMYLDNPPVDHSCFLKFAGHDLAIDTFIIDEDAADAVIQYALFGKIRYY